MLTNLRGEAKSFMTLRATPRLRVALLSVSAVVFASTSLASWTQPVRHSFRASVPNMTLEVKSILGSIKVVATEKKWITVRSQDDDDDKVPEIKAVQPEPGIVKVEVPGRKAAKLEIAVPSDTNLDLACYDCQIIVKNTSGPIRAVNTDGSIKLSGVRSARIEARSGKGSISFNGAVMPDGSYTFKSVSGRIDAEIASTADFKLSATCFRGGIGLGDFEWKFDKQTDKFVEARHGKGRALVNLWTQEGTIQLRRRQ